MPTYEFRCPSGHDFEQFYRKISDAPPEVSCPQCGVVAEKRISAGGGLLFKGTGFYITDYGKDGKKHDAVASSSSTGEGKTSGGESSGGSPDSRSSEPASTGAVPAGKSSGSAASESKSSKPGGGEAPAAKGGTSKE